MKKKTILLVLAASLLLAGAASATEPSTSYKDSLIRAGELSPSAAARPYVAPPPRLAPSPAAPATEGAPAPEGMAPAPEGRAAPAPRHHVRGPAPMPRPHPTHVVAPRPSPQTSPCETGPERRSHSNIRRQYRPRPSAPSPPPSSPPLILTVGRRPPSAIRLPFTVPHISMTNQSPHTRFTDTRPTDSDARWRQQAFSSRVKPIKP